MSLDLEQERQQAHALIDLLPIAKLESVRSLLELMIEDDADHFTEADRAAIQDGLDSLDANGGVSMEVILADLGLTVAEFEKLASPPESAANR